MSAAEDALAFALRANGIDGWEREHCFDRRERGCTTCRPFAVLDTCDPDRLTWKRTGLVPGRRKPWVKCKACNGKGFVTTGRKWALDFAAVPEKVAVEVNGGGWNHGRHHRPQGHANDCEKWTAAQLQGWIVILCTPEQVKSGEAVEWFKQALEQRREE